MSSLPPGPDAAPPALGDGLFVDLYELTMAHSLVADGITGTATFDLFVRDLPPRRRYLVAGGIDACIDAALAWSFDDAAADFVAGLPGFDAEFGDWLRAFRFAGDIDAVDEGEVLAGGSPLLTVTAPLATALLLETVLLNQINLHSMLATKAAHVADACAGRPFVDFSARRDHGREAAMAVARAAYIAGAAGTSLVRAGVGTPVPLSGTMAHAYVMAHDSEFEAFCRFLRRHGGDSVLLVDTYDSVAGTRVAIDAMRALGVRARGIRLDSGDLAALAVACRAELDRAGYADVSIFVSGDLDEDRVAALVAAGAPVDAFGVGTRMGTSADQPYLSVVYKLVEFNGQPVVKRSPGKATVPWRKQLWRTDDGDVLADIDEVVAGRPLLSAAVRDGRRVRPAAGLDEARRRCRAGRDRVAELGPPTVRLSEVLAGAAGR